MCWAKEGNEASIPVAGMRWEQTVSAISGSLILEVDPKITLRNSMGDNYHLVADINVYNNHSVNNQIPYPLRSVLPKGLPHLKGLEVNFISYMEPDVVNFTGATWYETENGEFKTAGISCGAVRTLRTSFMRSTVRGAPNIEELCLQNMPQDPAKLVTRDAQGSVIDIIPSRHGVGMELLGGENNPFAYNGLS
ncbi:hypothetical protein HYPSUDRAFT_53425 [Hypholoma sublateritium FD-334 SS-4]|uniref:Uncharacterized protein n=1 Tax=Hypholoma sublateritium (strain FD-334 SS-4) TaxID=945553 RepID=A0A0D2PZZ1_HYPSF|nr:hypothetical protein HYPSUDRAFT_53425 [Hypholoma sublateritium FD-334 SS-4]